LTSNVNSPKGFNVRVKLGIAILNRKRHKKIEWLFTARTSFLCHKPIAIDDKMYKTLYMLPPTQDEFYSKKLIKVKVMMWGKSEFPDASIDSDIVSSVSCCGGVGNLGVSVSVSVLGCSTTP
jgi:hypothetical protein